MTTITSESKTYQIRINAQEKQDAFAVFNDLGIRPSQAIRMFLRQVRITRSLPFPIEHTSFNKKTTKVLLENKEYSKSFNNLKDLFADLEK